MSTETIFHRIVGDDRDVLRVAMMIMIILIIRLAFAHIEPTADLGVNKILTPSLKYWILMILPAT